ncbi:hypothetical protein C8R43DRAFT_185709 [Mycena crocata]|nr:hypothetical protein C8R43DRAFT_185709 [Mycena crocata]
MASFSRRNRTTQSCLSCHATKRMCDRKRPCSRCSQLGISGSCVYEVDDPNRQSNKQDDGARLMNRIAELEGVIRELKNKNKGQDRSSAGTSPSPSPPRSGVPSPPNNNNPIWPSPSPGYNSSGSISPFPSGMSHSQPVPGYPRSNDSLASLMAAYAGLVDHMFIRRGGNCDCLNESACYNAVLELSLRLRRAADVLARSPSHLTNSDCALNTHISDLDSFAKNSLLDVPSHDSSLNRGFSFGRNNSPSSPSIFNSQPYSESTESVWSMGESDNFMSWVPAHRNV